MVKQKERKQNKVVILIVCIVSSFLVGILGSWFTGSGVKSEWYELTKPSITPPGWIFPIVWNILFLMIAISLFFAWINSKSKEQKRDITLLFGLNFVLNILWSAFYFGMQNPMYAFIDIILLEASIIWLIVFTFKISKTSSWLLLPYALWVGFASVLNYLSI